MFNFRISIATPATVQDFFIAILMKRIKEFTFVKTLLNTINYCPLNGNLCLFVYLLFGIHASLYIKYVANTLHFIIFLLYQGHLGRRQGTSGQIAQH